MFLTQDQIPVYVIFFPNKYTPFFKVISRLGTFLNNFELNKEKMTRAGFEPMTSRLSCMGPTNRTIWPHVGGLPILSISLFRGASQKP